MGSQSSRLASVPCILEGVSQGSEPCKGRRAKGTANRMLSLLWPLKQTPSLPTSSWAVFVHQGHQPRFFSYVCPAASRVNQTQQALTEGHRGLSLQCTSRHLTWPILHSLSHAGPAAQAMPLAQGSARSLGSLPTGQKAQQGIGVGGTGAGWWETSLCAATF